MIALLLGVWAAVAAPIRGGAQDLHRWLDVDGYLAPEFVVRHVPAALPFDRTQVGMLNSATGLIFSGHPLDGKNWGFLLYLEFSPNAFFVVTDVDLVDADGDGDVDGTHLTLGRALGNVVEEGTIRWKPSDAMQVRVGRMRIPFTAEHQRQNYELLFTSRTEPTSLFLRGTDLGGLAELDTERFQGSVGLFNGTGSGVGTATGIGGLWLPARGLLWSARGDFTPLGRPAKSLFNMEPLKLMFGAGIAYRALTVFDDAGFSENGVESIYGSASVSLVSRGFTFQAEGLQRQVRDGLTSRPELYTGAYGHVGYLFPVGVQPIARGGWLFWDRTFDERVARYIDVGANLYPVAKSDDPDNLRVTFLYVQENRITQKEVAHGANLQVQLEW